MKLSPFPLHQEWILIKSNWIIQLTHKFVAFFIITSILAICITWSKLPPLVPLWYSRPWGVDQLAPSIFLFILPISSLIIHFINMLLSMYVTTEYLIFSQSLFLSSLIVSALSCIAVIKIIFLVI